MVEIIGLPVIKRSNIITHVYR